jgi:hypothetical protein
MLLGKNSAALRSSGHTHVPSSADEGAPKKKRIATWTPEQRNADTRKRLASYILEQPAPSKENGRPVWRPSNVARQRKRAMRLAPLSDGAKPQNQNPGSGGSE